MATNEIEINVDTMRNGKLVFIHWNEPSLQNYESESQKKTFETKLPSDSFCITINYYMEKSPVISKPHNNYNNHYNHPANGAQQKQSANVHLEMSFRRPSTNLMRLNPQTTKYIGFKTSSHVFNAWKHEQHSNSEPETLVNK